MPPYRALRWTTITYLILCVIICTKAWRTRCFLLHVVLQLARHAILNPIKPQAHETDKDI